MITIMDYVALLIIIVLIIIILFIKYIVDSYSRVRIKMKETEEAAKTQRSMIQGEYRQNIRKMDGLFDVQLSKMGGEPDSEISQLLNLLPMFQNKNQDENHSTPHDGVSWETIKQQLNNPEIKKLILENKKEALAILQS